MALEAPPSCQGPTVSEYCGRGRNPVVYPDHLHYVDPYRALPDRDEITKLILPFIELYWLSLIPAPMNALKPLHYWKRLSGNKEREW